MSLQAASQIAVIQEIANGKDLDGLIKTLL